MDGERIKAAMLLLKSKIRPLIKKKKIQSLGKADGKSEDEIKSLLSEHDDSDPGEMIFKIIRRA